MKYFYEKAGVKTPKYHLVDQLENGLEFVAKVGYPVVVKPDNSVGANRTYKLANEEELRAFYQEDLDVSYIMEEYVSGNPMSYDGVCNSKREILFETSLTFSRPIMEAINGKQDGWYCTDKEIPEKLKDAV